MPPLTRASCAAACLAAIAVVSPAACARSPVAESARAAALTPSTGTSVAALDLAYDKPAVAGTIATASASGLPAGKTIDLAWGTVTGGWVVEDYYHFRGKKYSETTTALGRFPIDAAGRMAARFAVPEDYGVHSFPDALRSGPRAPSLH